MASQQQQQPSVISNHTSSSPSAAVAAAAAAAQQAATQAGGAAPSSLQPGAGGLLPQQSGGSGGPPPGFPQLNLAAFPAGFPAGFPTNLFTSLPPGFLNTFAAQAAAGAAGAAAAGAASPTSGLKKKQKGVTGAPIPAPILPGGMNPSHFAAFMAGPYGNPANMAAAAAGVNNGGQGGNVTFDGPQMMSGMPRGRWTEEMTKRLIDLRTKMDAKFRSVARPDRLWAEITTAIQTEFSAQLPRQSTKDKWKNLRSSYRLINQGKHPSHYTKETWPYYQDLEHYMRVRQEQEGKSTSSSMQLIDGNPIKSMDSDEDDDNPDDDDDDGEEDGDGKKKSGKKRGRAAASGAAAAVAAAAQAAAASAYTNPGSHGVQGAQAVNQLTALSPAFVELLRPKDVSRKERDWATMIRNLTGNLQQNIQDAHQQMIGLTSSVRDIAEKMAPSANTRRIKLETAAQHALRMADVQQEVEVVRAELKHLPLLMPLFEAYRAFFAQHAEQDKLEAYLKEKISKGQTVIFIALPLNGGGEGGAAAAAAGAGARPVVPGADIMSAREQQQASELVTYHSTMGGAVSTETHRNAPRSGSRPVNYALGFVHLVPSWSSVALSRSWIAADLFVSPPARNKGVASLLLTHAKKFAADTGASSIDIHTTVHNMHMQRMFARMEFQRQQDHALFSHTFEKQPPQQQ